MPGKSNEERLAEMFAECAAEMLVGFGVQATRLTRKRQTEPTSEGVAAQVAFGNAELHGCLTLQAPKKLLSLLQLVDLPLPYCDLDDWACEIVNQVVGRFRNRVASYAVKVVFGVPRSLFSEVPPLSSSHDPTWSPISFAVDDMVLDYWLDLETEPDFWLAESPMEEVEKALKEGSLVLF